MGDMDLPFEECPPGTEITDDFLLCGGVVVMATVIDVPNLGPQPGLVFRFTRPDGTFRQPLILVLPVETMANSHDLFCKAAQAAVAAIRQAS